MHFLPRGPHLALYAALAVAAVAAVVPFAGMLAGLYNIWSLQPEYSHGIVIPVISAFLIWRRRVELRELPLTGSWTGLVLVAAGLGLRFLGAGTTMHTLEHYAFLMVLYGLVLALAGPRIFRRLWMPLLILIFAIPLPSFFGKTLSLDLQLLSSQLGVWFIRAAGVSVLLEGNVIDLGGYQLEVAEACSGLRYLFPLMTLAFILAYLYRGQWWKRGILFVSSVPITVLMNSLRIGFIGITVDRWGSAMAEGVLHGFEGWLVFMLSTCVLILVAFVLTRMGGKRVPWREAFDLSTLRTAPATTPDGMTARIVTVPRTFIAACVLLLAGDLAGAAMPPPHVSPPARIGFDAFPTRLGDWTGRRDVLDHVYLDALKLDDYVLANYYEPGHVPVNLYVAYYQTQDATRAVHSPHDCIPGGGWQIVKLEKSRLPTGTGGASFAVNRAIVQLGSTREIVYYWFQERGRHLTNEYQVRWYLLWDALTRHRTDGALVRYVAELPPGAQESRIDAHIVSLAKLVDPQLPRYVPD
jgi:exosortase D (VPLPA-CTERM-specific)